MGLKDVLVLASSGTDSTSTYGVGLARACGASVTAAAPVIEASLSPPLVAELSEDFLAKIRDDAQASASDALRSFSEIARQAGATTDTIRFMAPSGDVGYPLSHLARCYDVTVLTQPDPTGHDTSDIIEAVLFHSGRPLIVVPYARAPCAFATVIVAWDGGVQAARAVAESLPILKLARDVQIVTIGPEEDESPYLSGRTMARHLARHGIAANPKRILSDEVDAANMLLSHAADSGGNLIVMGGYGHSRLREMILGGVTREILRSMTVPVLMSH